MRRVCHSNDESFGTAITLRVLEPVYYALDLGVWEDRTRESAATAGLAAERRCAA